MRVHTKYIAIEDITIMIGLELRWFHRLSFHSTWYFCPNLFTHSYRSDSSKVDTRSRDHTITHHFLRLFYNCGLYIAISGLHIAIFLRPSFQLFTINIDPLNTLQLCCIYHSCPPLSKAISLDYTPLTKTSQT